MKPCPVFGATLAGCVLLIAGPAPAQLAPEPADVIIHNAKVITVNSEFGLAQAIAVRDGWIVAVGKDREMEKFKGLNTLTIDARELTVMPGLYDANVQSYKASLSELNGAQPELGSIKEVLDYLHRQATNKPPGTWLMLDRIYPTRLKEHRLPTRAELDSATTNHPIFWNFGTLAVVNSKALEVSKITKETLDPKDGEVDKDRKTMKPTGLLRKNAVSLLKLPKPARPPTREQQIAALKHLYQLYNEQGITSIAEAQADPQTIDLFRELSRSNDLTVRINCARLFESITNLDSAIERLDAMTNVAAGKQPYGPTGAGDDWVRIGPLKTVIDGDVTMATAYLRTPYGIGPTYKITEPAFRGELKQDPYILPDFYAEAAQRGWQLSAHCAGDAALDFLLNCYQQVQFKLDIHDRRFVAADTEFQAGQHWERAVKLGVVADVEPTGLYQDGSSLLGTLGEPRLKNYLPLKGWFDRGLVIGGGSGHEAGLDPLGGANPWNPWLGIWTALTRTTSQGVVINADEKLTREQAIRLYTYNNAYLNLEENKKGSLEPGKLADLIIVDTDILKCPVDEVRNARVMLTMVNGKVVWEAKQPVVPVLQPPAIFTSTSHGPTVTITNLLTTLIVTNQVPTVASTNLATVVATTNQVLATADTNQTVTIAATNATATVTITNELTAIIVTNAPAVVAPATSNAVVVAATNPVADAKATNALPVATTAKESVEPATNKTIVVASVDQPVFPTLADQLPSIEAFEPATAVAEPNSSPAPVVVTNQPPESSDWSRPTGATPTNQVPPAPVKTTSTPAVQVQAIPAAQPQASTAVTAPQLQPAQAVAVQTPAQAPAAAPVQAVPSPAAQVQPPAAVTPQTNVVQTPAVPAVAGAGQAAQPQSAPDQPPQVQAVQFHPIMGKPAQPGK